MQFVFFLINKKQQQRQTNKQTNKQQQQQQQQQQQHIHTRENSECVTTSDCNDANPVSRSHSNSSIILFCFNVYLFSTLHFAHAVFSARLTLVSVARAFTCPAMLAPFVALLWAVKTIIMKATMYFFQLCMFSLINVGVVVQCVTWPKSARALQCSVASTRSRSRALSVALRMGFVASDKLLMIVSMKINLLFVCQNL